MKPRVTFITTLSHNVGDDFVREGILYLLRKTIGDFEGSYIHKHIPLTVRPEWEWVYHKGLTRRMEVGGKPFGLLASILLDLLPLRPATDRILNADLLIQCGAPVYWFHNNRGCASNEWYGPLIRRRWIRNRKDVPFLSLAGGTCQRFHSDGAEFGRSPRTLAFVREFYDHCSLTTLRDHLSAEVLKLAGREAPVLPCTSIFARRNLGLTPKDPYYVALNYMPAGGHYDFGQNIDSKQWERTFATFARKLALRERCILVCHNQRELAAARRVLPEIDRFHSGDYREVLAFYAGAKYGIINRVHGAFAIASYGRPAVVIGSDSRAQMAEMIGLKCRFVSDVTVEALDSDQNELERRRNEYPGAFANLYEAAEASYLSLLGEALRRPSSSVPAISE